MKTPTEDQLAYLIARGISKHGTHGTHDLENAVEQVNRDFEERIAEAVTLDVSASADIIMRQFFDINKPV